MNITHLVENLNRGGLERMVLDLVRVQHGQGHRCQVICLFEPGSLASELDDLGVPVHACGKRRGLDLRALMRMRRLVRQHATEILHTHNAVAHYQSAWATRGLRLGCVINTRHGMGENRASSRREWFYKHSLGRTDAVVTVCEAAKERALEREMAPAGLLCVIPNGIRVQFFTPADRMAREDLVRTLGLPRGTRLLGTVGRLNWAKNQVGLIRAFRLVHHAHPDTALVLIGDGELRDELDSCSREEGVSEWVHFLGDRDDVHTLLRGLDIFVLSSISEGYSMALLEACATGLPIVATDVGGNGEIVRNGVTGRLVPANDPKLLAEALVELLSNPYAAASLGHAARTWVETEGTLETMAARYEALYLEGLRRG